MSIFFSESFISLQNFLISPISLKSIQKIFPVPQHFSTNLRVSSSPLFERARSIVLAPSDASFMAIARPIPVLAHVTTAVFLCSFIKLF
jgi:hypothetical protein